MLYRPELAQAARSEARTAISAILIVEMMVGPAGPVCRTWPAHWGRSYAFVMHCACSERDIDGSSFKGGLPSGVGLWNKSGQFVRLESTRAPRELKFLGESHSLFAVNRPRLTADHAVGFDRLITVEKSDEGSRAVARL
jgi:hypothetical protein